MDDSTSVGVKLLADEDMQTMSGQNHWPRFWIGCRKDTTSAYLELGTLLATETRDWETDDGYAYRSGTPVRLRIDKEASISNFGYMNAEETDAFISNPIPILKKMIGHTTLLVEFTPAGSSPRTVKFTITGIEDAIADLRKTCHW